MFERWEATSRMNSRETSVKAVFFATDGISVREEPRPDLPPMSVALSVREALRLLKGAGYSIVLFILASPRLEAAQVSRSEYDSLAEMEPLLHVASEWQIDLNSSWVVGDLLDHVEVGQRAGCKTILLTNGTETGWNMTATRWPDLIAGNFKRSLI
jgi:histidinol phosphatase-like enzyme